MYEPTAVAEETSTASDLAPARSHRAFRLKLAVAGAIPAAGVLLSSAHAFAQGASCG